MKRDSVLKLYYQNYESCKNKIAVTDLFDEITYEELEYQSNCVSVFLLQNGIIKNSVIPICIENDVDRAVAILAVLKCGAAYILIDPRDWKNKQSVLENVLQHRFLLGESENRKLFGENWKLLTLEQVIYTEYDNENFQSSDISDNTLFCAHFTSGTTGTPKVVFVQHFDVYDMISAKREIMDKHEVENVVQYLSPYFAYGMEVYISAMMTGKTLFYMNDIGRGNIPAMCKFIKDNEIEMAELPASLINTISQNEVMLELFPENLKVINTAGESLYVHPVLEDIFRKKEISLYSEYGCSELLAAFIQEAGKLNRKEDGRVCLGKPIQGCECFVENEHLFLGRTGKTLNDYDSRRKELMLLKQDTQREFAYFDTMDLVNLSEGDVYIKGRANRWEKIRGYRVNLSEIEYCIRSKIPEIEIFVGTAETKEHVKKIGIVYSGAETITPGILQKIVKENLEAYKCPQIFIRVNEIPKNTNGKKDRIICTEMLQNWITSFYEKRVFNDIQEVVVSVVERYTGVLKDSDKKKNFSELDIDSLTFITILCEIESCSEIKIDLEDVDTSWIDTPEKLENYVKTLACF